VKRRKSNFARVFRAALVVLGAAILTAFWAPVTPGVQGGSQKQNTRPVDTKALPKPATENNGSLPATSFVYQFTQPQFHIPRILIEHDAAGRGQITFERLNEEVPIVEPLVLSEAALARVSTLWESSSFLESDTNYQSDKQFPHLGTIRLKMVREGRHRTAEFNWTTNTAISALIAEYRRVADQAIFVFDMTVARENQPLNSPKLMERLETLLRRNGISDPQQLVPFLQDISTDEHLPLIARHHADRLLKKIKK
jgi:hypothetical protein